jgi:predicted RND superfamily exporter protein
MFLAIGDLKLFLAAIPATVLPVLASLGFMGLTHITVRIGTAMILAIALGLAADDTIHLSVRIRDRVRSGSDPGSAVSATLLRTGRPCSFSSYVLIGGFASMMASSLLALRAMGLIATFTMAFALATDILLGPALYLLTNPRPGLDPERSTPTPGAKPAVVAFEKVEA